MKKSSRKPTRLKSGAPRPTPAELYQQCLGCFREPGREYSTADIVDALGREHGQREGDPVLRQLHNLVKAGLLEHPPSDAPHCRMWRLIGPTKSQKSRMNGASSRRFARPKYDILLEEESNGLRVKQHGKSYLATKWQLRPKVIEVVETALKHGLTCLWQKNHPRDEESNHISFSFSHEPASWVFVIDKSSGPPDVKQITFNKRFIDYFKSNWSAWECKRETGGGEHIFVPVNHLQGVLNALPLENRETTRPIARKSDKPRKPLIPEDEESRYPEGAALYRLHRQLERDTSLAKKAKQKRLAETRCLSCDVCGFDFERMYGELGAGYIETHHKVPVSELTGHTRTRISDLALVCSNCHRMLHRGPKLLSIDELRESGRGNRGVHGPLPILYSPLLSPQPSRL